MPVIVFCTAAVSGTFSSSTTLTPGIFLSSAAACGLRLVVAVVVARADVDDADGERLGLRERRLHRPGRERRQRAGGELREGAAAAGVVAIGHGVPFRWVVARAGLTLVHAAVYQRDFARPVPSGPPRRRRRRAPIRDMRDRTCTNPDARRQGRERAPRQSAHADRPRQVPPLRRPARRSSLAVADRGDRARPRCARYDWRASAVLAVRPVARASRVQIFLPLSIATPLIALADAAPRRRRSRSTAPRRVLALFIGQEFCYYWYHRAAHRVRWFWCNHAVHHSPNELEPVGGLPHRLARPRQRQRALLRAADRGSASIRRSCSQMLSLNLLYQFWIHATWIPKLGWLEGVLNTPSAHRVHHAAEPRSTSTPTTAAC